MNEVSAAMSGLEDFAFLYGEWLVSGRRLKEPLTDCDNWESFEAIQKCWPLLNGLGNVDELVSDEHGALSASLRFLDPRNRRWTIYGVCSRDGLAKAPAQGGFRNGIGEFFRENRWHGRPVVVRDRWLQTASATPIRDRAMSDDGGKTWETNWTMELTRVHWPLESGLERIDTTWTRPDMAVSF